MVTACVSRSPCLFRISTSQICKMASCSYVQNGSEADMDSLMTEDEWETLRLDSTDGGLPFHTLMIRPLCVCVCVCVCVCGLIWPQSVY